MSGRNVIRKEGPSITYDVINGKKQYKVVEREYYDDGSMMLIHIGSWLTEKEANKRLERCFRDAKK